MFKNRTDYEGGCVSNLKLLMKLIGRVLAYLLIILGVVFVVLVVNNFWFKESKKEKVADKVEMPEDVYERTHGMCKEASTTIQIDECNAQRFKIVEQINIEYFSRAVTMLEEATKEEYVAMGDDPHIALETFIKSREKFVEFRDQLCDSQYSSAGGTRRGNVYLNCKAVLTKQYTLYIWQAHLSYPNRDPIDENYTWPWFESNELY